VAKQITESLVSKVSDAGSFGTVALVLTKEEYAVLRRVMGDFIHGASEEKVAIYDAVAIAEAAGRMKGLEEAAHAICPLCSTRSWRGLDGRLYHYSTEDGASVWCLAQDIREIIDGRGAGA
jgi:hypothetical protein